MIPSGKARLACVIGWPVGHSRSPRLQGFWLEKYGIDGAYVPLPVRPDDFADALRMLPKLGFAGANVTVPHKEQAARLVDRLEPFAKRVGAVNTIIVGADGSLEGRNTDGFGFIANLKAGAPTWNPRSGPALVLGAGGAARAICAALLDEGVPEIRLVNRSQERAHQLAEEIGGAFRILPWDEREAAAEGAGLLVNTTTLGMNGAPALEMRLDALPSSALVTDIVYAPLETDLLCRANERGHPVVDGIGMLLHQARPGFAAWFGRMPDVTDELRAFVLAG
jgi:shikimate dehydrogenase